MNEIMEEEKVMMAEVRVEIEVISEVEDQFRTPGDRYSLSKYWNEMTRAQDLCDGYNRSSLVMVTT